MLFNHFSGWKVLKKALKYHEYYDKNGNTKGKEMVPK